MTRVPPFSVRGAGVAAEVGPPRARSRHFTPRQDPWTPCIYDARDEGCTPSVHPPAASLPPTPQAVFEVRPCRKTQN